MAADNPIQRKSYSFALTILRLQKELIGRREYVLANQLLRSGTAIGANVEEALAGQSRRDFAAKMAIASKEAREARFWLRLLTDGEILDAARTTTLLADADELVRLLTAIVKTAQSPKPPADHPH